MFLSSKSMCFILSVFKLRTSAVEDRAATAEAEVLGSPDVELRAPAGPERTPAAKLRVSTVAERS